MMNKKFANLGLLVALGMNVAAANAASTGTITFNGMITGTTCDVSVDGSGADATVTLPTVSDTVLDAVGKTAGKTNFLMTLSGCTVGATGEDQVAAYFQAGSTVDSSTGRLKQVASGANAATNVSLRLSDGYTDNPIFAGNSNQISSNHFETISGSPAGDISLAYEVEYYAEGVATPGLVNSNVVYSLQYK